MDHGQIVLWGALGGAVGEFLALTRYRRQKRMPAFLKTWNYWLQAGAWVGIGGLVAFMWLQSAHDILLVVPFQLGLTAPLAIHRMAANLPDIGPGSTET